MKIKTGFCLLVAALLALTGCSVAGPSISSLPQQALLPVRATSENASFFMGVPWDPAVNRVIEIGPMEIASLSIAALNTELPLESWTGLGWAMGTPLSETEEVPQDCALHLRAGMARQAYAACAGPAKVAIPDNGGDFVYVIFTDTHNRIARVLQSGAKYNPDATGLIP